MRKVVLFIACSLDGYIARTSGEVDWLFTDQDYGYNEFLKRIDTVIMGRLTYEQVLTFGEYPYKDAEGWVFSRSRNGGERDEHVQFTSNNPTQLITQLKQQPGKDIWLVGGAELIQSFLQQNLIDEFIISILPIILGDGIPLFRAPLPTLNLNFQQAETFDTGLIQLTYHHSPKRYTAK